MHITRLIGAVLLIMVLSVMLFAFDYFGGRYDLVNFPPRGTSVVVLGDSLSVGIGASSPEKGYVRILEERLGIPITNRSISGNTTRDGLGRIEQDILSEKPDIVLVLLGGNDYLRQIPEDETFRNLEMIIRKCQQDGATVLLIGIRGGLFADKFAERFETLARETGSLFVPNVLDGLLGDQKLMSDEVHPNDAGYLKIADKIAPELLMLISSAQAT
jgi:lysophospholipase L1-like esterase